TVPAKFLRARPSTIPKTSSGKIQRARLVEMIASHELGPQVVYESGAHRDSSPMPALPLTFGCHLPMFGPIATRGNVLAFARTMEALGYESLWASDHVVLPYSIKSKYPYNSSGQFPLPPTSAFLEPLTTLALVAGVTERARLGTSILVLPQRHPGLARKPLAPLEHLAEGRVILGVGVGWMREEIEILGGNYDRRGAWSDEAIRIMRACWSQERARYRGEFFSFDEIGVVPQPIRQAIPIWVGGHTPRALD